MQKKFPYGKQALDAADYAAVQEVLESDFLTCGPAVARFEQALCNYTGARYAVAVSNATAALHLAMLALEIGEGDEVITSTNTFLASANCILYAGGTPQFADVDPRTANIDPAEIEKHITPRTKAIIPVHFAGQSCDMQAIATIAQKHGLAVVEDAAHAIGSCYKGQKVGKCEHSCMAIFSFHPVKTITSGEGGAITTNDETLYKKLLALRSHGMYKEGEMTQTWEYEMRDLGFNYRMTDIQAALGCTQLAKLDDFKRRRREIVAMYNEKLGLPHLEELEFSDACFHLYPILVENRKDFYFKAKEQGLFLQVHYIPVHTQPYYQKLGWQQGDFPKAEAYYAQCISLPLYPTLTDADVEDIITRIKSIL